jgi:hypothetical protein
MSDIFWSTFYSKPAQVEIPKRFSFSEETELLKKMCKELLSIPLVKIEPEIRRIQHVSDEFALESPLTPSSSMFGAVGAGSVGETFDNEPFRVCSCGNCKPSRTSEWREGPCGKHVVLKQPYSFVHVNLSRRVGSIEEFQKLVEPAFYEKKISFRMLPGDSKLTVVMLARDREHEKEIRRILREKRLRIDMGIRIFHITEKLLG